VKKGDNMKRKFVMMPIFDKQWKSMGLTDDDLQNLQEQLLKNPNLGAVMQGTGGLRKMRFALPGRGKSGSCRVLYVDFVVAESIYFIYAYPKNEMDNLSKEERNNIKKLIEKIEETL
jgi:hypothetical protein